MEAITITQFASDPYLLKTPLWSKQCEILEEFWQGKYSLAIWALGRRSGKSFMAAVTAAYAGCMLSDEYKKFLRPGERFYIITIANTIDQARIALQAIKDLIKGSPVLSPMVTRETSDLLELSNGASFKALPASSRGGRGLACPLVIFDELAHAIDSEQGNAAGSSLYQALAPSTAQFGKLGKVLMLSSPWIQSGIFWELFKQASSDKFPHMQCVQAATWEINPTISKEFLEQEKMRDPELFKIEFGAEFTGNIAAFLDGHIIDTAINHSRGFLPPNPEFIGRYCLSLDPAKGGIGRDSYTATIVHYGEEEKLIVDLFHQFNPSWGEGKKRQVSIEEVESWILEQNEIYGFESVVLDQYNSQGTVQRLSGKVEIEELTWTSKSKTEAYSKLKELFNSEKIELYPHDKAIKQLKNLTTKYRSSGQWDVSGGTGNAVDDYCSALAGAILKAKSEKRGVWDYDWKGILDSFYHTVYF